MLGTRMKERGAGKRREKGRRNGTYVCVCVSGRCKGRPQYLEAILCVCITMPCLYLFYVCLCVYTGYHFTLRSRSSEKLRSSKSLSVGLSVRLSVRLRSSVIDVDNLFEVDLKYEDEVERQV